MVGMPPAKKDTRGGDRHKDRVPLRAVRVEQEVWDAFKLRVDQDGYETITEAMTDLLTWYAERPTSQRRVRQERA